MAPAFSAYAMLKRFGQHRGPAAFVLLGSLLPMLVFRFRNSLSLIKRLNEPKSKGLSQSWSGCIFKYATSAFCVALMVLDVVWGRWALKLMREVLVQYGHRCTLKH